MRNRERLFRPPRTFAFCRNKPVNLRVFPAVTYPARTALVVVPLLVSVAFGAKAPGAGKAPEPKKQDSQWVFELLPKAFQQNPRLEITVMTEMTDAGKKRSPATPSHPDYFESFSGGYHVMGDDNGDKHTLNEAQIKDVLLKSLASGGYLPAQPPQHPPTLLIVYTWGAHNQVREVDDDNPTLSGNAIARNMLDRASLVGGPQFAEELRRAFLDKNDAMAAGGVISPLLDPIELFKKRKFNNEFLLDQTAGDVYYVVASAYDYRSAATSHRVLLWRTRMTVAAAGVAQDQTLPTLVLSAGPYFGKEMKDVEIISKHAVPNGKVEVGTPTVVDAPTPTPDSGAAPAAK